MKRSLTLGTALLLGSVALAVAQTAAPAIIAPAGATAAIPQADGSVVFLKPLIDGLEPYIIAALGAIIAALGAWAAAILKQKTGVQISQAAIDSFAAAAKSQAGKWYASQAPDIAAKAVVNVHNPEIAAIANAIVSAAPADAAKAGMTPSWFQDMLLGEIGRLQASASVAPPAVPPAA